MMKDYEKVFLSSIRSSLWGVPVDVPMGFSDWDNVLRLAREQSMLGLVSNCILENSEIINSLPASYQKKMKSFLITNMMTHSRLNNSLILAVATLNKAGISPVLLKGQGLARNYRSPELRQCGDIDLYVGVNNYKKSYDALHFIVSDIDDVSELYNATKHFHAQISGTIIEVHKFADIHYSPTFNNIYQSYADEGLTSGLVELDFGGIKVNTPSDNFNAFYVFNHLWHHFISSGVGLRQVSDLAMFLHSRAGKLDLDYLKNLLSKMKLMIPWKTFGCIAVDMLGLPADEYPFYEPRFRDKSLKVLRRILSEGNFGQQTSFFRKHTRGYLYEKIFSFKCHIVRFWGMLTIFPFHATMQVFFSIKIGFSAVLKDLRK